MNRSFQLFVMALIFILSQSNIYPQIRIMPLGESIVRGASATDWGGFRRPLHVLLSNSGYDVDFIGGQELGIPDDFDIDHEGHNSWYADGDPDITRNRNLVDWVYKYLDDRSTRIVLLYIGTADLGIGDDAMTVVNEVESILNEIDRYERDHNKSITVILSTLINCSDNPVLIPYSQEISIFNSELKAMAENRINNSDNLKIIDMENETGLIYNIDSNPPFTDGDLRNNFFPNDRGFIKMAEVWGNALMNILGPGNPTLVNLISPSDEAIINSNSLIIKWEHTASTERSRLQIAKDFYFKDIVFDQRDISSDSLQITGLKSGTQYFWRIIKNDNGKLKYSHSRKFSVQAEDTETTNLSASILTPYSVKLSWNDITDNEVGFIIERKYGRTNYKILDTIQANTTSYTDVDTNFNSGASYTYRIKSFSEISSSLYSNEANIQIQTIVLSPSDLSSIILNKNIVLLSWEDESNNEHGFIVERKENNGSFAILSNLPANTISYVDSNLATGVHYTYRVYGFRSSLKSGYSNETDVLISPQLSAPANLEAVTISTNKVLLSWDNSDNNILGLIIERKTNGGNFLILDTTGVATSYLDSSITVASQYTYRIKSYAQGAESPYSSEVAIIITSVTSEIFPKEYKLEQNFPNPFNPVTTINFQIPVHGMVKLTIYDVLGNEIETLINEVKQAGFYSIEFDAGNLSSGVYFYKLAVSSLQNQTKNYNDIKKLLLLK